VSVRHPTSLVCKDVVELVTELLDDALDPVSRARIEQHLLVCPPCTIHVGQVRRTIELTGDLRQPTPTPMPASLLDAFRKATRGDS
jgi:anti-sigma factor RsiW